MYLVSNIVRSRLASQSIGSIIENGAFALSSIYLPLHSQLYVLYVIHAHISYLYKYIYIYMCRL